MLAKSEELGCSAPDAACLCTKPDFGYGIRDCSNAACGAEAAVSVISYGQSYCAGMISTISRFTLVLF